MISRFPKIIAVAVFALLCLTWLFRGQTGSSYYESHARIQHLAERPQRPFAAAPESDTGRVHYADTPEPVNEDEPASTSSFVPAPTTNPIFQRKTPYAYVFYATSDEYACSALVNMERLRGFHTPHKIYALVTDKVAREYTQAMEDLNVTVSVTPPPQHPHSRANLKEESLLKLLAFKMHHIDRDLRRVIVLDADQFIYHPLDSLFALPSTDLAAPRAYWKGNHQISTNVMVISLSDRVWTMVEQGIQKLKENWYEAELVQYLFEETVLMLPGQYAMIDQHFIDWDLPKWYRPEGDLHREGSIAKYSQAQLEDLWTALEVNAAKNPTISEPQQSQGKPELMKLKKRDTPKVEDDLKEEDLGEVLTEEQVKKEKEAHEQEERKKQAEAKKQAEEKKQADEPKIAEPKHHDLPEPPKTPAPPTSADLAKSPEPPKPVAVPQQPELPKAGLPIPENVKEQQEAEQQRLAAVEANRHRQEAETQRQAAEAEHQRQQAEAQRQRLNLNSGGGKTDASFAHPAARPASPPSAPKPATSQPPPHPYKPDTHPNRGHLGVLHSQAVLFHFGAIYKPWQRDYDAFKKEQPNLFPGIFESLRHWREASQKACPRQKKPIPPYKRVPGGPEWEWFHFVNNV